MAQNVQVSGFTLPDGIAYDYKDATAGEEPELEEKTVVTGVTSSTFTGTEGDITVSAPEHNQP